ncbi:MAG: ArsR/SmtB family transcription factor [Ktedonobacterales bacterium]
MDKVKGREIESQPPPPHVVDLRRTRTPDIEIAACSTYDFLLSLQVALASPEFAFADYDVGEEWVVWARRRCDEADLTALPTLDRYLGHRLPVSLHATLISMVAECPPPRDSAHFLSWLAEIPIKRFIAVLLDHAGQGTGWQDRLEAALPETGFAAGEGEVLQQLLDCFSLEVRPTVAEVIREPESRRSELLRALGVWESAVFALERPRITPFLEREAALLEKQRSEMSPERFMKLAMRGVEWRGPVGFRRLLFAPSYFCRPAVYYHEWRGTLTFCLPVEARVLESLRGSIDPEAPSEEILHFFLTLGDKTRLRILRLLAEREMYLTELSERLGLTKATTKHHMVMLRANGFVILYERDRMTYYALRSDIARHAARLISEYLGQ